MTALFIMSLKQTLLLWFCCVGSEVLADKGDPSMKEFFLVTLGLNSQPTNLAPQPIQVISAGLPRTGTASFVVAMSKLGLHSYHMKDGAVDSPGHVDFWYDLYHNQKDTSFQDILKDMSKLGFNATSDAPACFWYKEQMQAYPDAKDVLTVRGDGNGEAWAKSFKTAIIDVMSIMQEIPFRWMPMMQKMEGMVQQMFKAIDAETDPDTLYPVVEQLPAAYDQWVKQVKATVPSDNLLVFAPQDGWEPLCKFLSPISNEIASNCKEILASGEAYPNVNDKVTVQRLLMGLRTLSMVCKWSPILVIALAVSTLAVRRRKKEGLVKAKMY